MVESIRMKKAIVSSGLIFLVFILFSSGALAAHNQNGATVSIMTQNMDSGTDLGFVFASGGTPESVDLTLAEIQASQIPERADLLAAKIAAEHPDMVALQEATLYRVGPTPQTATQILYDQLELLLSALDSYDVGYDIVAVNTLTDIALPGTEVAVRYTDRDALLVRSDRRPPNFHISDTHTHIYDAGLNFEGLIGFQGWISADVHMGNKHFRLVVTHLQSPIPGVPEATDVQVAQTGELIHSLRNLTIPVVLCGDFNSDANFGSGPDATPSAALIETAGYADTWRIANKNDPGYTWPLFLEDQLPPPDFFQLSEPFERIDLFFSRDIQVISAKKVLAPALPDTMPPYGSDHAGVITTFQP